MTVRRPSDLAQVVLWMTVALTSFSAMALAIRETSATMTVPEVLSLNSAVGAIAFLCLAWRRGKVRSLRSSDLHLHLLRNGVQYAGTYAWAFAITVVPLAQVFAIEASTPIFTALFAAVLLGERQDAGRMAAVGLGALGILVIYAPSAGDLSLPSLLPLAAAAAFAFSGILTKRITRDEDPVAILFWMGALQLPMNLSGVEWGFWEKIDVQVAPALLVLCAGGNLGHYALAKAFSKGEAGVVAPMDVLRIPLIALAGLLLYDETVSPTLLSGIAVVLVANAAGIVAERRRVAKIRMSRTPSPCVPGIFFT